MEIRPLKREERLPAIDVLRGLALLGVFLMKANAFAGYPLSPEEMGPISRVAMAFVTFFAAGKCFALLAFLFGWGTAIQMARAERDERPFAPFYVRRLLALLAIGVAHAILVWDGDMLLPYALLGFFLLPLRKISDRALLVLAVIGLLLPILFSIPGLGLAPPGGYERGYSVLVEPSLAGTSAGVQPERLVEGAYGELARYRLNTLGEAFVRALMRALFCAMHVLGVFLLGLYAGRRRIFRDLPERWPFFRCVAWIALPLGLALAGAQVYVIHRWALIPEPYRALAFQILDVWGGAILCLGYVALILLLSRRALWLERLAPLAAVGRLSLTHYLLHSIVLASIFYGLGLYGRLAPSLTIVMVFVIYRAQIALSDWWLARFQFGPAEWAWRTLAYRRFQPFRLDVEAQRQHHREEMETLTAQANSGLGGQLLRHVTFLFLLLPALIFFIALAMHVGQGGGLSALLDSIPDAVDFTEHYLVDLARGDMGVVRALTVRTRARPVLGELARALPRSLGLLLVAQALALVIGLPLGVIAALRRRTRFSGLLVFISVLGVSTPSYFAAMLLIWFNVWLYRVSGADFIPIHGFGWDLHLILPALVLAARPAANVMRLGYNNLTEILDADFVRTAHAKGLRPRVVLIRHVLRNASVPLLTTLAVSLRFSLAILPIVEYIFSWGGVGQMLLTAIDMHDTTTVVGMVLPLAFLFVLINVALEILYLFLDPRLRIKEVGAT